MKRLQQAAVICMIGGMCLLVFAKASEYAMSAHDITKDHIGKKIKVKGEITSSENKKSITILKLDNAALEFIIFEKTDITGVIEVVGTVEEYGHEIQVVVSHIKSSAF